MRPSLAIALVLLGCALGLLGCAPAPDARLEPLPSPDAGILDLGAAGTVVANSRFERVDRVECTQCHVAEAAAWRTSLHAESAIDPIYLAERAHGRRLDAEGTWCAGCHAPQGHAVDCETCHLEGDVVLATSRSGRAPHATRVTPALATTQACAGCHDFDFPHQPGLPMQDTVDEWRESDRGTWCGSCHDPHATPARRDPEMAARALSVRASMSRRGDGAEVVLTLRSRAGHAVPTGDLFRRLVVRAEGGGVSRQVVLGRTFDRDGPRVLELRDTRVPARGSRTVVLHLPRAPGAVHWSIELEALPAERARADFLPEDTWRTVLDSGTLRFTEPRAAP